MVVVGPSGPQRTGLHMLLDKEDSPLMDEKGPKKILELSQTQEEAKILGINPTFGRFTMLRHGPH